jgi:fluoride ion exporter CrcB/FEX
MLGHQIVPALFGYLLGMLAAISCFTFGRHINVWLYSWLNPLTKDSEEDNMEEGGLPTEFNPPSRYPHIVGNLEPKSATTIAARNFSREDRTCDGLRQRIMPAFALRKLVFVLIAILISLFAVGGSIFGIDFYREMFLVSLMSPAGALLRWTFSRLNSRKMRRGGVGRFDWVPWGTFAANIIGSVVSIFLIAVSYRLYNNDKDEHPWAVDFLNALITGFAGSLSTVSSMVKEIAILSENYPGHAKPYLYAFGTTTLAMLLSLGLYCAIVRPRGY